MAFTPSKDHKRREREQKKLDKRFAREAAKAQALVDKEAEEKAAAEAALKKSEDDALKKEETDFEAELEAERLANEAAA